MKYETKIRAQFRLDCIELLLKKNAMNSESYSAQSVLLNLIQYE